MNAQHISMLLMSHARFASLWHVSLPRCSYCSHHREAFRGAMVLLAKDGVAPTGANGPYLESTRQRGFTDWGPSHFLKMLGRGEGAQRCTSRHKYSTIVLMTYVKWMKSITLLVSLQVSRVRVRRQLHETIMAQHRIVMEPP